MNPHSLPREESTPIRIGVSSCLLGNQVRFDGGHKRDNFVVDTLGRFVEFLTVCPEFEAGLGVPRETLRLVREGDRVQVVGNKSATDRTELMARFSKRRTEDLALEELSGFILKKDSPSCGMERVKVYRESGMPARDGRGIFAAALMSRFPNLPVEEEGRLNDARLRENFVERVFAYRRVRSFFASRWSAGSLVAFHTREKLVLMAHSPQAYASLGRLVAESKGADRNALRERYEADYMEALKRLATPARHANVLQHIAGYLREHLDTPARAELAALIDDYRLGLIPLVVPITMVRHYVARFDVAYLRDQVYLDPHPKEMMLRNHV